MAYRGARLRITSDRTYTTTGATVPFIWDVTDHDTDGFVEVGSPNGFTIPAGITKVQLRANVKIDTTDAIPATNILYFYKNGTSTSFAGNGETVVNTGGYSNPGEPLQSDVLDVVEGDYFELAYFTSASWKADADGLRTWFSIEAVETASTTTALSSLTDTNISSPVADQGLVYDGTDWVNGYPTLASDYGSNWSAGYRGALVKFTAAKNITPPALPIVWDAAEYDTDSLWSAGQPGRFTVPSGVTKIRMWACLAPNGNVLVDGENHLLEIRKNGGASAFLGGALTGGEVGWSNVGISLATPVLAVTATDYFEVRYNNSNTAARSWGTASYFAIEICETNGSTPRPYAVKAYSQGAPSASEVVLLDVAERTYYLPVNGGDSRAYALTAATASTVFDIRKNNVSVGSLTFGIGGQTGTFTVASRTTFSAGDRLSIVAPGSPDATLADVAISLALDLT